MLQNEHHLKHFRCWYCEREFEDDKVLISHQKAKHFRCSLCPRRLNTANGLAVHVQQVHKLEADRIENALPGRSTFEIEIFGMEGVPAHDRAEYDRRRAEARGIDVNKKNQPSKRKRIFKGVISDADFYVQLQGHRHIMSSGRMLGMSTYTIQQIQTNHLQHHQEQYLLKTLRMHHLQLHLAWRPQYHQLVEQIDFMCNYIN